MASYNSQHWLPFIRRLAAKFYESADKRFVAYNEDALDLIQRRYPERLNALKKEMFEEKDIADCRIDRHKLIALYVQFFLEEPLFRVSKHIDADIGTGIGTMLINELFCATFMRVVLNSWGSSAFDTNRFKEEYYKTFLRLLCRYRQQAEFYKRKDFFTFALAHVIYFIERSYTAS
jgi:hypothetical protein